MPITPGSPSGGAGAGGPRIARKTGGATAPRTAATLRQRATAKQINAKHTPKIQDAVKQGFRSK